MAVKGPSGARTKKHQRKVARRQRLAALEHQEQMKDGMEVEAPADAAKSKTKKGGGKKAATGADGSAPMQQ